jgi:hypothetical protein
MPHLESVCNMLNVFVMLEPDGVVSLTLRPVYSQSKSSRRASWMGVGYMDVVEALLPYRNATKIVLPIFDLEKIYVIPQNVNQSKNLSFI